MAENKAKILSEKNAEKNNLTLALKSISDGITGIKGDVSKLVKNSTGEKKEEKKESKGSFLNAALKSLSKSPLFKSIEQTQNKLVKGFNKYQDAISSVSSRFRKFQKMYSKASAADLKIKMSQLKATLSANNIMKGMSLGRAKLAKSLSSIVNVIKAIPKMLGPMLAPMAVAVGGIATVLLGARAYFKLRNDQAQREQWEADRQAQSAANDKAAREKMGEAKAGKGKMDQAAADLENAKKSGNDAAKQEAEARLKESTINHNRSLLSMYMKKLSDPTLTNSLLSDNKDTVNAAKAEGKFLVDKFMGAVNKLRECGVDTSMYMTFLNNLSFYKRTTVGGESFEQHSLLKSLNIDMKKYETQPKKVSPNVAGVSNHQKGTTTNVVNTTIGVKQRLEAQGKGPYGIGPTEPLKKTEQEGEGGSMPPISNVLNKNIRSNHIIPADSDVDIEGLQPETISALSAMADEFFNQTGREIKINSAKRSHAKQKHLWEANDGKRWLYNSSAPGHSLHESGYAFDVDSGVANMIDQLGLFDKYGFVRPIKGKEPWHITLKGHEHQKAENVFNDYIKTAAAAVTLGGEGAKTRNIGGKIPMAAEGAITNTPTIAGEAGPEAIVPLNNDGIGILAQAISLAAKMNQGNGANSLDSFKDFLLNTFIDSFVQKNKRATPPSNGQTVNFDMFG